MAVLLSKPRTGKLHLPEL